MRIPSPKFEIPGQYIEKQKVSRSPSDMVYVGIGFEVSPIGWEMVTGRTDTKGKIE